LHVLSKHRTQVEVYCGMYAYDMCTLCIHTMSKAMSIPFDVGRAMDLSNLHSNKLNVRNIKASMVVTRGPILSQSRGSEQNCNWLLKKHPIPHKSMGDALHG
jgi:hypothetical protein